ncbi:MAG TPA: arginyltransferase [Turneriella sp.]|nr:arginyltransferase [Turneriella sp.]
MLFEWQCGYYPERLARNHDFSDPHHQFTPEQLTRVLNKGYRRYATDYYRPYCRNCRECTAYRVIVGEFKPNRSMRRVLKKNSAVEAHWGTPQPTQEKFELYVRYQLSRHKETDVPVTELRRQLAAAMVRQMYTNPPTTLELTTTENGKVVGFAIFDRTLDALSAVYSAFEPDEPERSFGTLNILLAIEKARVERLPYLNLGLWLEHHPKMAYKRNFQPAEIYRQYRWRPLPEN